MSINLFTRQRMVLDHEVLEPTLLAITLAVAGFLVVLGACVLGIVFVPAFGYVWWTFAAVAMILTLIVLDLRGTSNSGVLSATGRQWWFRSIYRWARIVIAGVLACWLGLILWLAFCPGGPYPEAKTDPAFIRVVTWNIHCGQEHGLPWQQFDWPVRKHSLRAALEQVQPDILCVQEATPDQVAYLEESLPGHRRVGIGRDGAAGGEHCAIFFQRERFEEIAGNTFWLEEPIDQPRTGSAFDVKRICTWVRLRDQISKRTLRVYNTHQYLTDPPSLPAAKIIAAHIAAGDPADAVVVAADFNAGPSAPSRRLFIDAGLADSAGKLAGRPTFHLYGIGLWCIDGILVDGHWRVQNHLILDVKPKNTFPSDHFGLLADLAFVE